MTGPRPHPYTETPTTYAGIYGAENPWVQWLARHHPGLAAEATPRELRALQGVQPTPVPALEGELRRNFT